MTLDLFGMLKSIDVRSLNILEEFYNREGHCRVLDKHKEKGIGLSSLSYKERIKANLSASKLNRLNQIDFIWDLNKTKDQLEDEWGKAFDRLILYKRNGDCLVPNKFLTKDGFFAWGIGFQFKDNFLQNKEIQKLCFYRRKNNKT